MMRYLLPFFILLAGCSGGTVPSAAVNETEADAKSFWQWHAEKMDVDLAVAEAIDEPGGGNYAKAISITRASNFPPEIKEFDVGMLIIGSFDRPGSIRPAETIQQGLEMVENSTTKAGQARRYAPQQLRLIFERGAGLAPNNIPVDPVIAKCWFGLENGRQGDPARCIALRRERLPRVGR